MSKSMNLYFEAVTHRKTNKQAAMEIRISSKLSSPKVKCNNGLEVQCLLWTQKIPGSNPAHSTSMTDFFYVSVLKLRKISSCLRKVKYRK